MLLPIVCMLRWSIAAGLPCGRSWQTRRLDSLNSLFSKTGRRGILLATRAPRGASADSAWKNTTQSEASIVGSLAAIGRSGRGVAWRAAFQTRHKPWWDAPRENAIFCGWPVHYARAEMNLENPSTTRYADSERRYAGHGGDSRGRAMHVQQLGRQKVGHITCAGPVRLK